MRKFFIIAVPIVTIILFILILLSGNFLKRSLGEDDNIPQSIDSITEDINDEKWDEVSIKTEKLQKTWKRIVARVQFSSERDEINSFSMNIARLRGAIMAKDKASALVELNEALEHWVELGK